jgi:hypothetical protein
MKTRDRDDGDQGSSQWGSIHTASITRDTGVGDRSSTQWERGIMKMGIDRPRLDRSGSRRWGSSFLAIISRDNHDGDRSSRDQDPRSPRRDSGKAAIVTSSPTERFDLLHRGVLDHELIVPCEVSSILESAVVSDSRFGAPGKAWVMCVPETLRHFFQKLCGLQQCDCQSVARRRQAGAWFVTRARRVGEVVRARGCGRRWRRRDHRRGGLRPSAWGACWS